MTKPRSLFLLDEASFTSIYSETAVAGIQKLTENSGRPVTPAEFKAAGDAFADVEIVFSGWGGPRMDGEFFERLPNLKAFFYGAGSVRNNVTEAVWQRGLLITSSYKANAIPVAEFTASMIQLSLKNIWKYNNWSSRATLRREMKTIPGAYHGSRAGIISLGAIGQLVCRKLSGLEIEVEAYDPFAGSEVFEACGAVQAAGLEELFAGCDVVSLHAPWLPETENLVTGPMLRSMRPGATFINTARGAIVDEAAMIDVLRERGDLFAVLDVLQDEKNRSKSPLAAMPNVFLTPHIAGSMGRECNRLGEYAVEECRRYLAGEPPLTPVTKENIEKMA